LAVKRQVLREGKIKFDNNRGFTIEAGVNPGWVNGGNKPEIIQSTWARFSGIVPERNGGTMGIKKNHGLQGC
jgi:hypothetical protein